MNLVLVVHGFPKLSETFIVSKFLGLFEHGHSVYVVCNQSHSNEWENFQQLKSKPQPRKRVKVQWPVRPRWLVGVLLPLKLVSAFWNAPKHTFQYLSRALKRFSIVELLRRFYLDADIVVAKPDVIHFEFGTLAVDRMYLKEFLQCKLIVSFRGYDLNFSGLDRADFYDEVWANTDCLHLLGEDLWKRALARGCPPGKCHILIPPAIDIQFFAPPSRTFSSSVGTPERPLRIVSVGRLEWKKGYEFALQAVRLVRAQGLEVEYHIIGDGGYLEALTFCRHQLGLHNTVEFLGALPREQVREQLEWADVFLHAAVSEGFCNAVLEAQAMRLPVVTSDADGLAENVRDGVTGYVVTRRSPEKLAERMLVLANDGALRIQMGVAGRQRVVEHFDVQNQIQRFVELYEAVYHDDKVTQHD